MTTLQTLQTIRRLVNIEGEHDGKPEWIKTNAGKKWARQAKICRRIQKLLIREGINEN